MIPFKLDISDLIDIPSSEDLSDMRRRMNSALSARMYENWMIESSELKSSRQTYQNSIQLDKGGVVSIEGDLAESIENGMSAFDMKIGFSQSPNVKKTKDGGWYLTIPFRLSTKNTSSVNKESVVPRSITKILKNKAKSGDSIQRISSDEIPGRLKGKKTKRRSVEIEGKKFDEYVAKSGMYEGIQREGNESRGSYTKFRRVGSGSDANSWIHSGISARHYGDKAYNKTILEAPEIIESIIEDYL